MLHYYMHDGPAAFRFELAGNVDAASASKMEQDWRTASSTIGDRTLIIDLSFVTGIDCTARALFRRWYAEGAQFAATSKQSRELVESLTGTPFSQPQPQPTYEPWVPLKSFSIPALPLLALLTLLTALPAWADDSAAKVALARYEARQSLVADRADVTLEIDASLPGLSKKGHIDAIRRRDASGKPAYEIVDFAGDDTVKHQVIARYLAAEQDAYAIPAASVAFTPDNYKFRYAGSIEDRDGLAYVFTMKPRHRSEGLMEGQIWIDAMTGAAVHQEGRLVKRASVFIRKIRIIRDTGARAEAPYSRISHIEIDTVLAGRAELTIRERPTPIAASSSLGEER